MDGGALGVEVALLVRAERARVRIEGRWKGSILAGGSLE